MTKAKPKVSQAETPYTVTQDAGAEPTGKVAQQESPVTYTFDSVTQAESKAVEPDEAEDKAVSSSRTTTKKRGGR